MRFCKLHTSTENRTKFCKKRLILQPGIAIFLTPV